MLGMPERLPPSLPPTTHARTARTSRTHATRARTHSLPCPQALVLMGEWETAYARVCTYLKIDYEDDAAELQKLLQTKCAKAAPHAQNRTPSLAAASLQPRRNPRGQPPLQRPTRSPQG